MTRQDFLLELQDMLQSESAMQEDTVLPDLEEWDSLAFMVLIAYFDKSFALRVTFVDLKDCKTPADLIDLARGAIA